MVAGISVADALSWKLSQLNLDCSLSNFAGQPSINFKVDQFTGTGQRNEIHVTQTHLGLLITIALHPGPSAGEGDPQFSFLFPEATLESGREMAFETIGCGLSARLFEQVRSSEGLERPAREHPQAADIRQCRLAMPI